MIHTTSCTRRTWGAVCVVGCLMLLPFTHAVSVLAADYPQRPIRLIVPSAPGGSADKVSRGIGAKLGGRLGQQVVVDNRPGASGVIASELAARAAPDGYTIILGNVSSMATNVTLKKNLPYDPIRDFAPVTQLISQQMVVLAHPSINVSTIPELIRVAKAAPEHLTFGSSGFGAPTHLSGQLLAQLTGIELLHVPYKGVAPAMLDVVAGQVVLMFPNIMSGLSAIKNGQLRALAVTGPNRSQVLPDLPTVSETGVKGYASTSWFGILAPRGTPKTLVSTLNQEIVSILKTEETKKWLLSDGAEPIGSSPEEFASFIKAEIGKWGKVVKTSTERY